MLILYCHVISFQAQYYILEKIKTETMVQFEEVHYRAEILVPKPMIGRIIGKGGQHVSTTDSVVSMFSSYFFNVF